MVARAHTVAFLGVEAKPIEVQCALSPGLPAFHVVGLPDKAVSEARDRVRSALGSMAIALPSKRITINLSPADLPKEGSHFDLPIAVAILAGLSVIPADEVEGIVALLEPFIDTVVVCTMTALVIVITGAYSNPEYASFIATDQGAALTSAAMGEEISWFPYILTVAVALFAYSTMISWSYYGERCWTYLFGEKSVAVYRGLFLIFVFLGSIVTATNVLVFSDLMILAMAIPNIIGLYLLSGKVGEALKSYEAKLKSGELEKEAKGDNI